MATSNPPVLLLVDDDVDLLEVLAGLLENEGIQVLKAGSGSSAVSILAERSVDAIVTDLRMPDGDGVFLIDRVREKGLKIPVIAITGYSDNKTDVILKRGAHAIFQKPFRFDELLTELKALLQNPASSSA